MSDEPKDDAPVPESVGDSGDSGAAPQRPARPVGRIVQIGCVLLTVLGLLVLLQGAFVAFSPEDARCNVAERLLEDEAEDDDDLTDAEVDDERDRIDDLSCDQAIAEADALEDEDLPSEGAMRTQGVIFSIIGLVQAALGFLTLRTRNNRFRIAALVAAALGIVVPILGLISYALVIFVVYAIGFSADSKAVFGAFGRAKPQT